MDKSFAKKYIISLGALFFGALVISCAIVFGIKLGTHSDHTMLQCLVYVLVASFVPVSFFNGYCALFVDKGIMKDGQMYLFVALIIPIILACIPYGFVMLVPMIIKAIKKLLTN